MELYDYIRLLKRWSWLIILAAFLAGGTAFLFRSQQTPKYQAQVMMSVGTYIQAPNPNSAEITTGVELAQTYVHLAKTYTVLEATIQSGNFPITSDALNEALSASEIEDTSLIKIMVSHADPVLAVRLADEVARQLIVNSPSNLTPQQQSQIDLTNAEIARLEKQLEQERLRLETIESQLAITTDPAEYERLTSQYNTVISNINQASSTIAQFSATLSELQQRTNSLDVVDPARILDTSPGTNTILVTILGAIAGCVMAWSLILLIEYLDRTIRTPDEVTQLLALPALAAIPRYGKRSAEYQEKLFTHLDPHSPVAEEYRALRTNMMFSSNGSTYHRAYVISSAGPGEGKTLTTANLAVAMAIANWRVLLVDADLHRPRLHDLFGADNQTGLATLLSLNLQKLSAEERRNALEVCVRRTKVPGLSLITSGHVPSNPTEMLGSVDLREWYDIICSEMNIDTILFDTPPILALADVPILANSLHIPVILVVRAGQTRPGSIVRAKEKLTALDIDVKGFVLNAMNPHDQGEDYDQSYYYYYYRSAAQPPSSPRETVEKQD